ncbi:MAG: hypothetical protein RLZZ626_1065 [Actinomycetota bacterium]
MNFIAGRRLIAGTAVIACILGFSAPLSASAASACIPAPKLVKGKVAFNSSIAPGVYARAYTFNAGVSNSTNIPTKFSYVTSSLTTADVVPTFTKVGAVANQLDLANQFNAIAHMNDDYFFGGSNAPWGAFVSNSTAEYVPPRATTVFAISKKSVPDSTGYTALGSGGTLSFGGNPALSLVALNRATYKLNSAQVFTPDYSHSAIPRGKASIAIDPRGKIVGVSKTGSTRKPKAGIVISAVGTAATMLQKAVVGQKVQYVKPEAPYQKVPSADTITMTGALKWGVSSSIPIIATNTSELPADPNAAFSSGATLFDSYWNGAVPPMSFMIVIDKSTSKVVAKYNAAGDVSVAPNQLVVTFTGAFNAVASTLKVGTEVIVDRSYATDTKLPALMALGRGPLILQNKKVVITCNGNEEQIRPRSVIAWNTKGQIWFFTATSGINMIDNGFRVGGATAHQMAEIAQQFGATEAVRVDGGGSTTMIIKSKGTLQRLDLPNEAWQRPIPVGIAMVAKSK